MNLAKIKDLIGGWDLKEGKKEGASRNAFNYSFILTNEHSKSQIYHAEDEYI